MKGSRLLLIFIAIVTIALGATAIWIGWRLSQEQEVTPETGMAGGPCELPWDECGKSIKDGGEYCDGTQKCQKYHQCPTWNRCANDPNRCCATWQELPTQCWNDPSCKGDEPPPEVCKSGADCNATKVCEYPDTTFCECGAGGVCTCLHPDQQVANWPNCNPCLSVNDIAKCDPPPCDTSQGWIDAGVSGSHSGGTRMDNLFCNTSCASCGNNSRIFRYCKKEGGTTTTTTTTTTPTVVLGELLRCESLRTDPAGQTNISEDDLRAGPVELDLVTTGVTQDIQVVSYTYGSDITGAQFSSPQIQQGATLSTPNTLTIPQDTEAGTYNVWVRINGSSTVSGNVNSGCTGIDQCTPGADLCQLELTVGPGTCDCTSLTPGFSGNPRPGSYISYIMQVADQNGTPCEVDATDITWTTTGSPTLIEESRSPASGTESPNHNIVYRIPPSAPVSTEYCVETVVAGGEDAEVTGCSKCFTTGSDDVSSFIASKTAQIVCINNNNAAQITYTINVRNVSQISGTIEYIEDTYDSRYQSSWISGISPSADSHTGNVLRWDNGDSGYTLAAGAEMSFSYIVTVPSTYFGAYENSVFVPYEYRNAAIVKPQGVQGIELNTVVEIVCQPGTGILDNAVSASLAALLLIIIGLVGIRFSPQLSTITERARAPYKEKFEKRTLKEIE